MEKKILDGFTEETFLEVANKNNSFKMNDKIVYTSFTFKNYIIKSFKGIEKFYFNRENREKRKTDFFFYDVIRHLTFDNCEFETDLELDPQFCKLDELTFLNTTGKHYIKFKAYSDDFPVLYKRYDNLDITNVPYPIARDWDKTTFSKKFSKYYIYFAENKNVNIDTLKQFETKKTKIQSIKLFSNGKVNLNIDTSLRFLTTEKNEELNVVFKKGNAAIELQFEEEKALSIDSSKYALSKPFVFDSPTRYIKDGNSYFYNCNLKEFKVKKLKELNIGQQTDNLDKLDANNIEYLYIVLSRDNKFTLDSRLKRIIEMSEDKKLRIRDFNYSYFSNDDIFPYNDDRENKNSILEIKKANDIKYLMGNNFSSGNNVFKITKEIYFKEKNLVFDLPELKKLKIKSINKKNKGISIHVKSKLEILEIEEMGPFFHINDFILDYSPTKRFEISMIEFRKENFKTFEIRNKGLTDKFNYSVADAVEQNNLPNIKGNFLAKPKDAYFGSVYFDEYFLTLFDFSQVTEIKIGGTSKNITATVESLVLLTIELCKSDDKFNLIKSFLKPLVPLDDFHEEQYLPKYLKKAFKFLLYNNCLDKGRQVVRPILKILLKGIKND